MTEAEMAAAVRAAIAKLPPPTTEQAALVWAALAPNRKQTAA